MNRYSLIFLLLTLWGVIFISAQESQQLNVRFLPPDYYVGDTVELQFTLRSSGNMNLLPPETLPDPGWVKLLSFKMESSGSDQIITIRFIPYYPGTRTLPPLVLGDLTLRDIKIYTSSVLGNDDERVLSSIRHNMLIPGTRIIGALIFSTLLSLPILLIFLFKVIRRHTGVLIRTYRLNLPYRKFIRLLKKIRQTLGSMSDKDFFTVYSGGLKNYLSTRFNHDFSTLTTLEMEIIFRSSTVAEPLYLTLLNLFHRMDRVKFAGDELTSRECEGMLLEAEQISGELENWRKSHADF